jgi:hypothetical protein
MKTSEIISNFGNPADTNNFVTIVSPFPLKLDWDLNKTVVKITVHKQAAPSLSLILQEILSTYGLVAIEELGINQFAGCFNNRPKRGTEDRYKALMEAGQYEEAYEYLSLHTWALAVDFDADRNTWKETSKTARFARPEYKPMIDIFYKHGWYSLGREKNYDWMHLQFIKP